MTKIEQEQGTFTYTVENNDIQSLMTIFCPQCKRYHIYENSARKILYCPNYGVAIETEKQKQEEEQMNNINIKAGDIVKVIDWRYSYSTYTDWFLERADKLKPEWIARYAFGDRRNYEEYDKENSDGRSWEVLFVDGKCVLITQPLWYNNTAIYLINIDGLSSPIHEMTLSEIEAALGYPIKIIEEEQAN